MPQRGRRNKARRVRGKGRPEGEETVGASYRVPLALRNELRVLCVAAGIPQSEVLRTAIASAIPELRRRARERLGLASDAPEPPA